MGVALQFIDMYIYNFILRISNAGATFVSNEFCCFCCAHIGEHLKDEFAQVNPFRLVPVIDDNGFKLTERLGL